jgi:hypothetical protein
LTFLGGLSNVGSTVFLRRWILVHVVRFCMFSLEITRAWLFLRWL